MAAGGRHDEPELHRWFAVELHNRTWAALEAGEVGPDSPVADRERLLYGAVASAYHWRQAGTQINHARAEHLIARAALRAGLAERALGHALRCLDFAPYPQRAIRLMRAATRAAMGENGGCRHSLGTGDLRGAIG